MSWVVRQGVGESHPVAFLQEGSEPLPRIDRSLPEPLMLTLHYLTVLCSQPGRQGHSEQYGEPVYGLVREQGLLRHQSGPTSLNQKRVRILLWTD
jgi:hypothetical protein